MTFELQDVILDLLLSHDDLNRDPNNNLARINFFKSRLVFEAFSDFTKDVDLVSQEILLSDMRFQVRTTTVQLFLRICMYVLYFLHLFLQDCPANKRSNVFTQILKPMQMEEERKNSMQAEVHFRSTQETNRFTVLLYKMRLMGIFDWWIKVLDFISKGADDPKPAAAQDVDPRQQQAAQAKPSAQTKTKVGHWQL